MVSETVIESRIKVINLPPRGHYLSVLVSDENVKHGGDRLQMDYLKLCTHMSNPKPYVSKGCTSNFSPAKISD